MIQVTQKMDKTDFGPKSVQTLELSHSINFRDFRVMVTIYKTAEDLLLHRVRREATVLKSVCADLALRDPGLRNAGAEVRLLSPHPTQASRDGPGLEIHVLYFLSFSG